MAVLSQICKTRSVYLQSSVLFWDFEDSSYSLEGT